MFAITNEKFGNAAEECTQSRVIAKNNFVIEPWTQLLFDDFTAPDDVRHPGEEPKHTTLSVNNTTRASSTPVAQQHTLAPIDWDHSTNKPTHQQNPDTPNQNATPHPKPSASVSRDCLEAGLAMRIHALDTFLLSLIDVAFCKTDAAGCT